MNNREIVDYILSGKLKPQQVIKKTYNNDYEEGCMYIYYDEYCENNCNDNYNDCWLKYFKELQKAKGDVKNENN